MSCLDTMCEEGRQRVAVRTRGFCLMGRFVDYAPHGYRMFVRVMGMSASRGMVAHYRLYDASWSEMPLPP